MLHLHILPYMVSAHLWFNLKAWSLYHIIMYTITFGFMIHKAVKIKLRIVHVPHTNFLPNDCEDFVIRMCIFYIVHNTVKSYITSKLSFSEILTI